eukprot:7546120-Lingulodinium_polyedra.AAC.1
MDRANVRFASRCENETPIRPRHCAAFGRHCAMTLSNRRLAATTARKWQARAPGLAENGPRVKRAS